MPDESHKPATPRPPAHGEEFGLLVDAVRDYAIFLLSPTGEIRSWNTGAERTFGYTREEAVGMNFSSFYSDPDNAAGIPAQELVKATRDGDVETEGWRVRKDGTRFWADTVITALITEGQVRGFAKVTRDLTERRAAEEQLRQSEEMFRLLVESVKDYAIFMLDPTGHVMTWNLGAERTKGYTPDEILGKHFSVFYSQSDIESGKPARNLEEAMRNGRVEDEGWRLRKDGTRFWANVVITAVHDESGNLRGFAKVTRDITARKQAEETQRALLEQREARLVIEEEKRRVESSYRAAQEANRAKDEFLMTLSHELRTPMTAILGWSRLIPTLKPEDPMFREAIAAIGRSAQLQAKLIDDVLDVSRIVSGKLRLTLETVDVIPMLRDTLETVRASAGAKEITLTTHFEPNIGSVTVDTTRVHQIIWNLLTNAVKFTPRGGRVDLSAMRTASQIMITVTDSGEGIDPQFLPHMFEPFRQAETPSTRVHGGLGLGLSIVRYLAEAHGGSVAAESEGRGKGARFTVSLPVHPIRMQKQQTPSEPETLPSLVRQNLANRRVLVVDDDRDGREVVAAVLRQAGALVTTVDSAPAALDAVRSETPDIIVTDIAMPEMDGYALRRRLRENPHLAGTPVVALTAFPASAVAVNEKEFDAYLRKPIDPFELTEKIDALLKPA
jgi:PAS domain S-box-containing protein